MATVDATLTTVTDILAGERGIAAVTAALGLRGPAQRELCRTACTVRDAWFPARKVESRSVLEVSNVCQQRCRYCGIASLSGPHRFTLDADTICDVADTLYARGRRVLMLQSGENPQEPFLRKIAEAVRRVKVAHADMRLILCLGSLPAEALRELRAAGADRYILKFETSNPELYRRAKPRDNLERRLAALESAAECGFTLGSGSIVGLPGQTAADVAADLLFTTRWGLDMVSASVFVPGERSAFAGEPAGDVNLAINAMAILRLINQTCLIPSTSSLDRLEPGAQLRGLWAGANTVTVHDGTPVELRGAFPIYSSKRILPQELYLRELVQRAGLAWSREPIR